MQSQLYWAGHVVCMKDHQPPEETALWQTISGQALTRRPEKALQRHWTSPWNLSVLPLIAWNILRKTDKWHEVVKCGAKVCQTRRNTSTELCRKLKKDTATSATAATIPCSHCPRLFCAQIGLISHLCTHGCLSQS